MNKLALGVAVFFTLLVTKDASAAQFGRSFGAYIDAPVSICGLNRKCSAVRGGTSGSCRLTDGRMAMRSNGKVSWTARVASNGSDDAYCATFSFLDRNGVEVFKWPRICSQRLSFVYQTWFRDTLAIPEHLFKTIQTVRRADHC